MTEKKTETRQKLWGWKYLGKGTLFLPGIPAKNISAADARRRELDTALLDASELYEKVYQAPKEGE